MSEEWEIHFTHRDVVDARDGLVVLEWKLNRAPESEWVKYFISGSGSKSGTRDFLSRVPDVIGSKIRFTVLAADLENAVKWVESRFEGVNQMFDTYVMSRRREEESRRQVEKAEKERQLSAARQRLEALDS